MRSSFTMQAYAQTPPVGLQLHAPQHTSCSRVPSPTAQGLLLYYAQQRVSNQQNNHQSNQQSHVLWNGQSSSQPVSSSSNLQSRPRPQTWFTDSQNRLLLGSSTCVRSSLPNGHFAPFPAAQHGTSTQKLSHHPQTLNGCTVPQQNYDMPHLHNVSNTIVPWFPSNYSNASSATEQNKLTHQSVLPQYQSLNEHHNRMQIAHQPAAQPQQIDLSAQILHNQAQQKIHNNQAPIRAGKGNGALYNSVNHFPATPQRLITPSQPSNYSHQTGQNHTNCNRNQAQHSSQIQHQPSPYRTEINSAGYGNLKHGENKHQNLPSQPPPPYPKQRKNQRSVLRLPQDKFQDQTSLQQCNTTLDSGHHSQTCHSTVPAIQGNKWPQESNNASAGLSRSSQVAISSDTPTREALPLALINLLVGRCNAPAQRHGTNPLPCLKARFPTQGQTPNHVTPNASYPQTPESTPCCSAPATLHSKNLQRVSSYQTPVKTTAILKENEPAHGNQLKAPDGQSFEGMQSRRLQLDSNIERKDGHNGDNCHEEVQYSEDIAESLELVTALQKMYRQFHKAVAVVPPISQQPHSPEKNYHVPTSTDDSLPFKIDAVCTLVKEGKNVEQESNAPCLPKETIRELLQLFSIPDPETQEPNKPEEASTVNSLIPETQSTDIPQSQIDSTTSQDPVCSTVSTSKSSEGHNEIRTGQSNGNMFDVSKVQVLNFTPKEFIGFVKVLESTTEGSVKEPVADVRKRLLDLYWDGSVKNLVKQIRTVTEEISGFSTEVSIKEMQTAVFHYLKPELLKMLEHSYHILKDDTNLPAEDFTSSWLNINGQPADVDSVLTEPILDFNFTDYASHGGFNALDLYSEFEPSTKVIPATTACQDDQINKNLANTQVCASKPTDKVSSTQEASKKQEDEKIEKHQQQNVNMNPEECVDTVEIVDTLTESKSKTKCEQICRDTSEDIPSSSEMVEQRYLSYDDSSDDSQLIEFALLSSDDARTIFKEYSGSDLQKEPCQDETKGSATSDNKSNEFCNSTNQIKFTCPHVIYIDWNGDDFCPKCWEETPLLDLDLEEALFSPKGVSSTPNKQDHHNHSYSPQTGKPDSNCTELSEDSSIADSSTPKVSKGNISEPDPNPCNAVESCTLLSSKSPVEELHSPVCTESVCVTMPVEEQDCGTNSSKGPKLSKALSYAQNLVISEQTKTPRYEVSPPKSPPCKKFNQTKTTAIPAGDDNFTAGIVTTNANAPKPHPNDLGVTPAEDNQNCKDERKERGEERRSPIKLKMNAQSTQSSTPNPNVNVFSETSSVSSDPSTYGVNMSITEPVPNLGDSVHNSSSPSAKSPDKEGHRRVCSEIIRVTMSVEQVCEANSWSRAELPKTLAQNIEQKKPVILSKTKTSREKNSPPSNPPSKRLKVTKTVTIQAEDDLFTPDIVVKKASSPKPHPSYRTVTPAENNQYCKDERKDRGEERKSPIMLKLQRKQHSGPTKTNAHGKWYMPSVKSQVPNVTPQPKSSDPNKDKVLGKTNQIGQNKEKQRFSLYGFSNGNGNRIVHQCTRTKSSTAPAYVTISNSLETAQSYTDAPSAKQKVYSQWSSTFVETKKNTSSHKHQKPVKAELKSRTPALKRLVQNRFAMKEKQSTKDLRHKQSGEDFVVEQEAKKLKCTTADENL
ncbi:hypothetical protein AMELA_G00182800 [Ameiurus melas]|uniref:Uncharacterized protein n=1 Tax=Ameiurus melas TaxID=219545 RepID=A0A7J6ACM8_AMEME|nr:hypothetical protein AMELA_G00182800 [Ameiurus melas]